MTTSVFKDLELKLGDEIKSIPQKGEEERSEGWEGSVNIKM